ncbi:MAG TPA: SMP-30/gluconolactonase/LRE family protein [Woeseiaceae bacterium]|nr:SMP-30/gluconolactonase/LRE family protein [Woeseiaceae bacterium]
MPVETTRLFAGRFRLPAIIITLPALAFSTMLRADDGCEGSGDYSYLCGPVNAEDLVLIPDTKWIIASGFGGDASLYLIDSERKTWAEFYPTDEPRARQNMATYGACPGSPDPDAFVAHGLNIRPGGDGHSTLYVVGHGEREAIEVFELDASGTEPVLTWTGCVMTPDGMEANSVASFGDGSLVATIPLYPGIRINEIFGDRPSGAVYEWSPGDAGFTKIQGTEMPYANGIEASDDGREFYVASSGLRQVLAFSNSNPARLLRASDEFSFIPDNLHRDDEGNLITAGLEISDPVCGEVPMSQEFDFEEFASCPRPFTVLSIDPESLQGSVVASSPAHEHFSNITIALEAGAELWVGTFAGDRIAYRNLQRGEKQ